MPDEPKQRIWPLWYVDEYIGQWTLNESNPDGSDGYLADFGTLGEPACRRAAHCHNLHDRLVDMLREVLAWMDTAPLPRMDLAASIEALIAEAEAQP